MVVGRRANTRSHSTALIPAVGPHSTSRAMSVLRSIPISTDDAIDQLLRATGQITLLRSCRA